MASAALPQTIADYEVRAGEVTDPATWHYFERGSGENITRQANLEAFRQWRFRPRVLVDVSEITLSTTVLGTPVSMPVLIAPFAAHGLLDPEGERAVARAAARADTIMCVATGTTNSHEEIRAAASHGTRWVQLYILRDRERTREHLSEAVAAGVSAIVLTADAPYLARDGGPALPAHLTRPYLTPRLGDDPLMLRASAALTWEDVSWTASESGLPVVVKGVLTGEDALLALESGAAAIIVSNHGGRQLDGAIASIDALPEVVEAVAGRCDVLVDGGIRRGGDVLKALALGASTVLVGRPIAYGLAVAGEAGVSHVLEILGSEIEFGLALLGCRSVAELSPSHLVRVARSW